MAASIHAYPKPHKGDLHPEKHHQNTHSNKSRREGNSSQADLEPHQRDLHREGHHHHIKLMSPCARLKMIISHSPVSLPRTLRYHSHCRHALEAGKLTGCKARIRKHKLKRTLFLFPPSTSLLLCVGNPLKIYAPDVPFLWDADKQECRLVQK